jgi:NAD(P)-dependent dehydrogenase (short-subunit alcohol dehydrogenase family)
VQADLSKLAEVRRLADHIAKHYPRLHILVNNVGARYAQREETIDGLEATIATTHLSPFLLTNLLLPVLETNAPARIVNVNSYTHRSALIGDLQSEKDYDELRAYAQAKLANLLASYELARRLHDTNIRVNVADPGIASGTELAKKSIGTRRLIDRLTIAIGSRVFTSKKAAKSSIYLASSPDVEYFTGKYVDSRCKIVPSSLASYDRVMAENVWIMSAELTGLENRSLSY